MNKLAPFRKSTRPTFRPRLEWLETRLTPATYTVSSLADSGAGSLRAAITSANADATPDEIDFSVAGVIKVTSADLPTITNTSDKRRPPDSPALVGNRHHNGALVRCWQPSSLISRSMCMQWCGVTFVRSPTIEYRHRHEHSRQLSRSCSEARWP